MCFPDERIAYKQLRPPATLIGHSGEWSFEPDGPRVRARARHTVAIDPASAKSVLGQNSTLDEVREHLRASLGADSRATLIGAGMFARSMRVAGHG